MSFRPRRLSRPDAALLGATVVVALIVILAAAGAGTGSQDERARMLEGQLRCPTCQGLSIADSPATSATQMRALVREQLAAGASDDAVRAFFVARYGRWILLDPPVSGVDLALWFVPAAAIGIGAFVVVRRARVRDIGSSARHWDATAPWSSSRWPVRLVGLGMVFALVIPIAAALGPRLVGAELTGRPAAAAAASIDELEAFVRAEPRDVEALVQLGTALFAADRAAEAAARFRAALDVDRDNVAALMGIGTILLGADRPDAAGPFFDRVLALSPDQHDALLYRAVARLRLTGSLTDEVRRDLQRFLEVAAADDPRRTLANDALRGALAPAPSIDSQAPVRSGLPEP